MLPKKKETYYKIMNSLDVEGDFSYDLEYNDFSYTDFKPYFTDIKHVFAYCNSGSFVREIEIPYDGNIEKFHDKELDIPVYSSDKIIVGLGHRLNSEGTIKYLIESGADVTVNDYAIIKWSIIHGDKWIYKYLINLFDDKEKDIISEKMREFISQKYKTLKERIILL